MHHLKVGELTLHGEPMNLGHTYNFTVLFDGVWLMSYCCLAILPSTVQNLEV